MTRSAAIRIFSELVYEKSHELDKLVGLTESVEFWQLVQKLAREREHELKKEINA